MNRMASYTGLVMSRFFDRDETETGQGMVEYALIISLVVIILIVVVIIVGNQTVNMWSDIQTTMKNASS
ncbi:MAG TPA: Flp family type IVb pilin [Candidatus Dormibacteraeota bacterium]|nr:Flp family type IVb pilin [Candidatus Dormibacteraeota bacterium]